MSQFGIKRLSVVTLLGFSSGLPLALSDSTLQAWLATTDVDIQTIGWISLAGIPYVLKFLWAPLLDYVQIGQYGRRRGWMFASQILLIAALFAISLVVPQEHLYLLGCLALTVAFLSATQDIAVDAYRTEILPAQERGTGVGLSVASYRLALILASAGALIVADQYGFQMTYAIFGLLMLIGVGATWWAVEPRIETGTSVAEAPTLLRDYFLAPIGSYLSRKSAWIFLCLIISYKLGDAFAAKLATTFFLRHLEFSLTEIGAFYKTVGLAASIAGGIGGGLIMYRVSLYQALLWFAVFQTVTNLGFVWLALTAKSYTSMVLVVISENLFGGMGTAAFIALIMALCDRRFTATQFALLTAIASLGRVITGPIVAELVAEFGWASFFALSVVVSMIPIAMLLLMRPAVETLVSIDSNEVNEANENTAR